MTTFVPKSNYKKIKIPSQKKKIKFHPKYVYSLDFNFITPNTRASL